MIFCSENLQKYAKIDVNMTKKAKISAKFGVFCMKKQTVLRILAAYGRFALFGKPGHGRFIRPLRPRTAPGNFFHGPELKNTAPGDPAKIPQILQIFWLFWSYLQQF